MAVFSVQECLIEGQVIVANHALDRSMTYATHPAEVWGLGYLSAKSRIGIAASVRPLRGRIPTIG
jgi:hypothetical protein